MHVFFALGESIQSLILGCPPRVWGIGPVTASEKRLHNDQINLQRVYTH